jgi:hypothetical protein
MLRARMRQLLFENASEFENPPPEYLLVMAHDHQSEPGIFHSTFEPVKDGKRPPSQPSFPLGLEEE